MPMDRKTIGPSARAGLFRLVLATTCLAGRLVSAAGQPVAAPADLERWYVAPTPEFLSRAELRANNDVQNTWVVSLDDGRPKARRRGPRDDEPAPLPFQIEPGTRQEGLGGRRTHVKVDDGWIVSFNAGEFGAGLWWFSPDGSRRIRLGEENVRALVETRSGLLAFEGLAHGGGEHRGRIARLARGGEGRWERKVLLDLKGAPAAVAEDSDGSLVVATYESVLRVDPGTRKVETLVDRAFWGSLYPDSMVVTPAGSIFLGMRHGVARIDKKGGAYRVSWLLPDKRIADEDAKADEEASR